MELPSNMSGTNIIGSGGPFPPSAVVGDFQINEIPVSSGGGFTVALQPNPDRVALFFPNAGPSSTVYWTLGSDQNTGNMCNINQNLQPTVVTFRDVGPLVCQSVGVVNSGFGTDYTFFEIIYKPAGR